MIRTQEISHALLGSSDTAFSKLNSTEKDVFLNGREDLVNLKYDCSRLWAIRGVHKERERVITVQAVDRVVFVLTNKACLIGRPTAIIINKFV